MRFRISLNGAARRWGAVAFGAAAFLAVPFVGVQGQGVAPGQEEYLLSNEAGPSLDLRTVRRGFDLFASGDGALAGMRMTGNNGVHISNYGPCSNVLRSCQNNRLQRARGGTGAHFFHDDWVVGAPPHEWLKIRQVAPEVANATGRGWTAGFNGELIGRPVRFGPHDGTLGRMFSGVTSTDDGSCRDNTGFANGQVFNNGRTGIQILPASDCAETWGSDGWQGDHPIDLEGYKAFFDVTGSAFRWDYWRVPDQYKRLDKMFLGTRFHTYGEVSDYNADMLAAYGSAVPGGSGSPARQGYPLGILIHFESFNFAVPTVAAAQYVRATVINRSEDVYGTGIDYDSLYFGISQGTLIGSQSNSRYALPDVGLVLYHQDNAKGAGGPCDDTFRRSIPTDGCGLGNTNPGRGYGNGAVATIVLASPLGDLRNKAFTRTAGGTPCTVGVDAFCNPAHPEADDTITFNQMKFGDFGSADAATWGSGARASFGYLSGTEANTLDGRAVTDLSEISQFRTFRNIGWPNVKGVYNKYVPGDPAQPGAAWDWNDDGVQDTLYLDTCGPNGCVDYSSDTLPGGHINRRGNVGGLQAAGPFPLGAGDTTTFWFALVADGDSTRAWSQINAAIELYLTFFLAPEAPPPARVVSTQVTAGTDEFGTANPEIRFFFSDDPERWVDPFLTKVASDVENAPAGTDLGRLRDLNDGRDITIIQVDTLPGPVYDTTVTILPSTNLVAALQNRAADNLERIEIYKSCDGGTSFTSDGDCDGDPATDVDGNPSAFGFEAYAVFDVDDNNGDPPNAFTDGNVDGGRTYLYVIVAKSRGATFLLNTPTGLDTVSFAPSIRNVLSRSTSDPNVLSVYVPASRPAGFRAAQVNFTERLPGSTVPFEVEPADAVIGGAYRAVFGNQIVVERDSSISAGEAVQSTVTIRRRETVEVLPSSSADSIIETESFVYALGDVFPVAGAGVASGPTIIGDIARTTTTYSALGFVIVGPNGPIFGSTTLTGDDATPNAVFVRPNYPGFSVNADNSVASTFRSAGERQLRGPTSIAELGLLPSDTVVPRGIVNSFMVQWREGSATRPTAADAVGRYEVAWADDPFGLVRGLTLNLASPTATEAELAAALAGRAVASTGLTDAETATLLNVDQVSLVPVRLPFTVRNLTFDRPVDVAMVRRLNDRIVIGNAGDTISAAVPSDAWLPGDALYFIEDIVEDSTTANGLVLDGNGNPEQQTRRTATFTAAVLGCDSPRPSCNPVSQGQRGATGYNPMRDGDRTQFEYYVGFGESGAYAFDLVPPITGSTITSVTDSALSLIRVVPNPYVVFSQYQTSLGTRRVLFTNVPPRGVLRIYTVAGQFVQEIKWEPSDLLGDGDLFYDLKSREGIDIASGLYLWVLTAPSNPATGGPPVKARGKFVVITGDAR